MEQLYSIDDDVLIILSLQNKSDFDENRDLFDVTDKVFFANRFPSFNQLESGSGRLNDIDIKSIEHNPREEILVNNEEMKEVNCSNLTINAITQCQEMAEVGVPLVKDEAKDFKYSILEGSIKKNKSILVEDLNQIIDKSDINDMNNHRSNINTQMSGEEPEVDVQNKIKKKRFGREQDREMIENLIKLCREYGQTIDQFWNKRSKFGSKQQEILLKLKNIVEWKGSKLALISRIKKLGARTEFSVRERKLLKRLLVEQIKTKSVDFSKLEYYFPGKRAAKIKKESDAIIKFLKPKLRSSYRC